MLVNLKLKLVRTFSMAADFLFFPTMPIRTLPFRVRSPPQSPPDDFVVARSISPPSSLSLVMTMTPSSSFSWATVQLR